MKRLLILILALTMCVGLVSCGNTSDTPDTETNGDDTGTDTAPVEKKDPNKIVTLVCSYDTTSYDIAPLVGGQDHQVEKNGEKLDSTTVKLDTGANIFDVEYKVSGIDRTCQVRIARREGYRVVLNTNGGSFVETQYVADGGTINDADVKPKRNRYTFAGWYNEKGEKVTLANTPIVEDTTFIAHWDGPNAQKIHSKTPLTYTTSSAALNINWRDYANAFKVRPEEVYCTLKNTATNETYSVWVTKDHALFVGEAPAGASISQGAGSWTVKITGLTGNYTFTQDPLENDNYTVVQSGTSVINTLKNYEPMGDDSTRLITANGRFYDIAGNVVVLKGLVPWNVSKTNDDLANSTSISALKRIQEEGCNVIRITVGLGAKEGYQNVDKATRDSYINKMKLVVERASSLGMYCIVDWGVMNNSEKDAYLAGLLEPAKEFFGIMSQSFTNNPYIIYELANEPNASSWTYLKEWEETLIRHIRSVEPNSVIIAAPNMHSRRLSEENGNDPIDKPFPTEISYNIAHTFHCYAYTTTYNVDYGSSYRDDAVYGWRVSDAINNGLTVIITEFSPANASMKFEGGYDKYGFDADYMEANKWLNFILENDVNYTLFRFGDFPGGTSNVPAQFMFLKDNEKYANNGTWTYDMLSESGKWYYDNVLNATGFIKVADFSYKYDYASATPKS